MAVAVVEMPIGDIECRGKMICLYKVLRRIDKVY